MSGVTVRPDTGALPGLGAVRPAVAGWGYAVPQARLTNADLQARGIDTTAEWIVERTGIRERRVVASGETTTSLAVAAGEAALRSAGITAADLSIVMVATCTPEQPIPETSVFVAEALGARGGAFDVSAACAGFTYGLVVASGLFVSSSGTLGPILVIGAENLTRVIDPTDRSTAVLFGDAAGAAVLAPSIGGADGPGVLAWDTGSDGTQSSLVQIRAGGSRQPPTPETVAAGKHWMTMRGRGQAVFRRAVRIVVDSSRLTLGRAGIGSADVDWFVSSQANVRIVSASAQCLGIPDERCVMNLDRFGNTGAASIPLALAEAAEEGRFASGDLVLISGYGAGLTWASVLLRWGRPSS